MKTVAFVTIKLNSQRLPNKNILPLMGRPLCWHINNTLLNCRTVDEVYVYCSDESVRQYIPEEVIFLKRPEWLDGDLVRAKDTYTAFIDEVEADIYVAGLTTAPFILPETIDCGVRRILSGEYDSAFAASKHQTFAWYQGKTLNYELSEVPRTQEIEPVYLETSGFFAFKRELWVEHGRRIGFHPYIQEVSHLEAVDIDEKEDYEFAKLLAAGRKVVQ